MNTPLNTYFEKKWSAEGLTPKILLLGNHPIGTSLVWQYEEMGCMVVCHQELTAVGIDINDYGELCLLTNITEEKKTEADNQALTVLGQLAVGYDVESHGGRRLICHLLLQSQTMLWLMQTLDVYQDISRTVELYPFTMEDQWAKNVFCHLPGDVKKYLPLDWKPIMASSNRTVHLLINGFDDIAESLALHAALIAHFPNYVRNHSLRTRITILDDGIKQRRDSFIQRYHNLFDNSFYRFIELGETNAQVFFHKPMYDSEREDFVDIEWEFVEGNIHESAMQQKLRLWAGDQEQLLTIALCSNRCDKNMDEAFVLPPFIQQQKIPVLVYVKHSSIIDEVRQKDCYQHLFPFGMVDSGYDVRLPLLQMAKRLNYFYICSYGQKGTPMCLPINDVEEEWRKINTFNIRYSNINNVMTIASKMRSLGHDDDDWEKFYAMTQEEVELISAVEHNRWSVDRLILGFRPPRKDEREAIESNIRQFINARERGGEMPDEYLKDVYKKKKVHYDLCDYRELREDKTGQNVRIYDYDLTACIPLIANSYKELGL